MFEKEWCWLRAYHSEYARLRSSGIVIPSYHVMDAIMKVFGTHDPVEALGTIVFLTKTASDALQPRPLGHHYKG